MSANDTTNASANASNATQPAADGAANASEPAAETPFERTPLSEEQQGQLEAMLEQSGASVIFQHIADGTDDRALVAIKAKKRRQVALQMKIGEIANSAASRIAKSEERAAKVRTKKGATAAETVVDDDDDDDDED